MLLLPPLLLPLFAAAAAVTPPAAAIAADATPVYVAIDACFISRCFMLLDACLCYAADAIATITPYAAFTPPIFRHADMLLFDVRCCFADAVSFHFRWRHAFTPRFAAIAAMLMLLRFAALRPCRRYYY